MRLKHCSILVVVVVCSQFNVSAQVFCVRIMIHTANSRFFLLGIALFITLMSLSVDIYWEKREKNKRKLSIDSSELFFRVCERACVMFLFLLRVLSTYFV